MSESDASKKKLSEEEMRERIRRGEHRIAIPMMNIPPRYQKKGLHNFDGHSAEVAELKKTILEGQGAFITGPCGSGKTHLAIALMLYWYAEKFDPRRLKACYLSLPYFFLSLRNSFGRNTGDAEADIVERYSSISLLLIDDLGAQKISEWSRESLYVLVDRRYREKLPTIVTSNLDLDQISELIDDRIASRLAEMCTVMHLAGDDHRVPTAFNTVH
jgi:DNA replication protein DnaC